MPYVMSNFKILQISPSVVIPWYPLESVMYGLDQNTLYMLSSGFVPILHGCYLMKAAMCKIIGMN